MCNRHLRHSILLMHGRSNVTSSQGHERLAELGEIDEIIMGGADIPLLFIHLRAP